MTDGNVWWQHKSHQGTDGRWVVEVRLYAERPHGLEVARLLPDTDISFESKHEADSYGEALATKWLKHIRTT